MHTPNMTETQSLHAVHRNFHNTSTVSQQELTENCELCGSILYLIANYIIIIMQLT